MVLPLMSSQKYFYEQTNKSRKLKFVCFSNEKWVITLDFFSGIFIYFEFSAKIEKSLDLCRMTHSMPARCSRKTVSVLSFIALKADLQ